MAEDKSVFLNPYNFISFPQKKAEAYTDTDKHTGVIEYTITTKTPLFIPNSSSDKAFKESETVTDHKSYDFFSYTNLDSKKTYENEYHLPVIPGSEMRGVVRNVYETLTDSCMGLLNEEIYPVKRSYEKFIPGLLCQENGKIVLYEASSMRIGDMFVDGKPPKRFEKDRNGTEIFFSVEGRDAWKKPVENFSSDFKKAKEKNYRKKGYLLKWGMSIEEPENEDKSNGKKTDKKDNKKARYHVYQLRRDKDTGKYKKITFFTRDKVERKLLAVVDSYQKQPAVSDDNKDAYEEYEKNLQSFLDGEIRYFPVNYSALDKENIYLAPAVYSKEVYDNNIGKLAGEFAPCKEDFCPACDLITMPSFI